MAEPVGVLRYNSSMLTDAEKDAIRHHYQTIGKSLPGFRPRSAQRQMLACVAQAFARSKAREGDALLHTSVMADVLGGVLEVAAYAAITYVGCLAAGALIPPTAWAAACQTSMRLMRDATAR